MVKILIPISQGEVEERKFNAHMGISSLPCRDLRSDRAEDYLTILYLISSP